ncbi:hypothetical protein RCU10_12790 [Escherichia marmotae]|nr:hypothetical protein [Escherichia coli]MED0605407.1 hypothetical protein [Escherichia marmotae]MED0635785.1 hypothetical protein [Escherichia marmotae]
MTTFTKEQLIDHINDRKDVRQRMLDTATISSGFREYLERELATDQIALASLEAEAVLYQSCTRPTWNSGVPWTEWKERSREGYENDLRFTDTPDHAGWINKCRKLYTTPPAPLLPDGLVKAVRFYEQVKRENPPVETGAWKDAVDWVLKEAFQAVSVLESSREHEVISQQEKA